MALVLLGLVLVVVLAGPRAARAVEFDEDGFIAADEVIHDDLFISANSVVVNGTINGTLFASGENVTINGDVNGDLIVAGAEVMVNGAVNGNVAFIGFSLQMNGPVKGSLFFLGNSLLVGPHALVGRNIFFNGFSVETQPGSQVRRDVSIGGYQALLNGQIDRNVNGDLGGMEIGGRIGGDIQVKVSEPVPFGFPNWPSVSRVLGGGLHVTEEAEIEGNLVYASPVEQSEAIKSKPGGGVVYQPLVETPSVLKASGRFFEWILKRVQHIVTLLALGGLVIWRRPNMLDQLTHCARRRPLPSFRLGIVALLTGGVGSVLLVFLTFILGLLLGVIAFGELAGIVFGLGLSGTLFATLLAISILLYGSKIVVSHLVGVLILDRLAPQYSQKPIWPLALGVIVYVLLRSIPLAGLLVGIVATVLGLGAMWMGFWQRCKST